MQQKIFIALALLTGITGRAQLNVQEKGVVFLAPGAVLSVQGDVDSRADILGPGTVLLNGMSMQRLNMNGYRLPVLQLDNDALLDGDVHIGNRLQFVAGRMSLSASNLFLEAGAGVAGYDRDHFVITNGQGMLVKRALDNIPFTFPVGSAAGRYDPITLTQNGEAHDLGVRAMPGSLSHDAVNVNWEVKELTPGSNELVMMADWDAADELPGFDRTKGTFMRHTDANGWEAMQGSGAVSASGDGRYILAAGGQHSTGVFSIAMTAAAVRGNLRVFPNPAKTGFNVYAGKAGSYLLNLYDLNGRLIVSREVSDGYYFVLDVGLAAGTYLLQVKNIGSTKIVIVK